MTEVQDRFTEESESSDCDTVAGFVPNVSQSPSISLVGQRLAALKARELLLQSGWVDDVYVTHIMCELTCVLYTQDLGFQKV